MPAITYQHGRYDPDGESVVGLQVANRALLTALATDPDIAELGCCVSDLAAFENACRALPEGVDAASRLYPILPGDSAGLARAGVLHRHDPLLGRHLWERRFGDERGYSITGIIHSISSREIMEGIGNSLIAPFQPWDALICSSRAGRDAVRSILDNWGEYLGRRLNAKSQLTINLPIIPLAIDAAAFSEERLGSHTRARLRAQLGIADDAIAVLSVGRLTYRRKANPVPMFLALQRAQRITGAKLHFIMAGQFEHAEELQQFEAAAEQCCPDVSLHIYGGATPFRDPGIWRAGDIFLSLADNIQETFGLAPVEAMAAGLPAVVSDWDGYRDTVRDRIDGFLIPTAIPTPGAGRALAQRYFEHGNFRRYYGTVAMSTAVDVDACAAALARLINQPDLRRRMGEAGRQRALAAFDLPVMARAYRELWAKLAEKRKTAPGIAEPAGNQALHPLCDDPFRTFSAFASRRLSPQTVVELSGSSQLTAGVLPQSSLSRLGGELRMDPPSIDALLELVRARSAITAAELATELRIERFVLERTLVWLHKFGLVSLSS